MRVDKKLLWVLLFFSLQMFSQETKQFFNKADQFFKIYIANGKVDYKAIHSNQESLNELFSMAENISVTVDNPKIYQAFWINAYNLSVIKGVIIQFPIKSPLDISGFFDKSTYKLAGKEITLNDIENKLLRAQFKDPRFHFVLVCGAIGCPPLISKVYLPSTLDEQLESQTILAMNGDYFIRVNTKKKRVEGSEILKWYKEDFTMNGKTEIDYINKYRTDKIQSNYKLIYTPYNWKLNKQ